ncbi:MAG: T9SS type A sorting domain-containing protein, partial [Saprospiraceae bacterium]|nr:T9SS type A sorting domain-containing protein [Saprospiraceae bacterium]
PEDVKIDELLISEEDIDFVAIKTGDINGTATANSRGTTTRSANQLLIETSMTKAAGISYLEFYAQEMEDMIGLQFTLDFGQDVDIRSIVGISLDLKDHHINKQRIKEGLIMLSWNDIKSVNIADGPLFKISVNGDIDKSLVQLTSEVTPALAYDGTGTEYQLSIRHINDESVTEDFILHQNQPNPFNEETSIMVTLPEDMTMDLTFYDISGRKISSRNVDLTKGTNVIPVKQSDLNVSGVVYYQLSNQMYSETKKMIILE